LAPEHGKRVVVPGICDLLKWGGEGGFRCFVHVEKLYYFGYDSKGT
jgi:hypothetical protein